MNLGRIFRHVVTAGCLAAAMPATAQVAAPPLEAYGELPTLEDMALSRSGRIAMLATSDGKRAIIALDEGLKPTVEWYLENAGLAPKN